MDSSQIGQLIFIIILIALSAFFSSSETALVTVNKIRMRTLAEAGDKRAKKVLKVIDDSGKMLSAILIGNNIVNIAASSIATTFTIDLLTKRGVASATSTGAGIATGVLTFVILIFGEISPKTMATIKADKLALAIAGPIRILMIVLTPIIFIINLLSRGVLFLFRVNPKDADNAMTEEELRTIVDVGQETGVIEDEEREMIHNVFDFGDSMAKEVMIPRIDVSFVDVESTYEELIEIVRRDQFTRFPVYEDTTDNVIGILNAKDLLFQDQEENFSIRTMMRPAYITYEHKNTSDLFIENRKS
ncbi:MAG: HlyC/CorC family transporter, partial [Agathobacter sp.]|nr:HlyC/CorC family transporter [Agathobacter sp.]